MTEKRFIPIFDGTDKRVVGAKDNGKIISFMDMFDLLNDLSDENEELKSTIAQLIEQNRKNNDLLLSDIRILEKALWCSGCENDYGRINELRKEFMK